MEFISSLPDDAGEFSVEQTDEPDKLIIKREFYNDEISSWDEEEHTMYLEHEAWEDEFSDLDSELADVTYESLPDDSMERICSKLKKV